MHELEPYYNWIRLYSAEQDSKSPFYGREHSEFEFSDAIYNYLIHPQWDHFGSPTLYLKVLFADYEEGYVIIEMIGEWNDAIENDIMELKREVLEKLMIEGVYKFILIAENVFNFHSGDRDYYEELYDELSEQEGWAVLVNLNIAAQHDFLQKKLQRYIELMEYDQWRTYKPDHFFQLIDRIFIRRL